MVFALQQQPCRDDYQAPAPPPAICWLWVRLVMRNRIRVLEHQPWVPASDKPAGIQGWLSRQTASQRKTGVGSTGWRPACFRREFPYWKTGRLEVQGTRPVRVRIYPWRPENAHQD